MERKARENLSAARVLAQADDPCPNAAVSRAYYAAYQACWVGMEDGGRHPDPNDGYFKHATFPADARANRVVDADQEAGLEELRDMRVQADYYRDDITQERALECVELATELVVAMLGGEDDGT